MHNKKKTITLKGKRVAKHGKAEVLKVMDSLILQYGISSGSYTKKEIDAICTTYQKRAIAVGMDKNGRPFAMFQFSVSELETALKDVKKRIRDYKFDGAWVHLNPELSIYVRSNKSEKKVAHKRRRSLG